MTTTRRILIGLTAVATLTAASCGGDDPATDAADAAASDPDGAGASGTTEVEAPTRFPTGTITADEAAALLDDAPDGLVVLDVRTPEEFAEGHLAGAVLVDFYDPDFTEQLAALDPDLPYVVYCRSGNRSGQTMPLLEQLGFESAVNVDGGILSWAQAGLPVTAG